MGKKLLLKTQTNEILKAIRERGLNPSEFQWTECDSKHKPNLRVSSLVHRPTGYYFVFDFFRYGIRHVGERSPGMDASVETERTEHWANQCEYAMEWLGLLKQELEAPDLWAAISQETKLAEVASSPDITNEPFTSKEQSYIITQLREVKEYLITTQNLIKEHEEVVKKRFDYLEGAVKRLGRQDWITSLGGVLLNIVIQIGLNPNAARELFRLAANSLSRLWGGTPLLP